MKSSYVLTVVAAVPFHAAFAFQVGTTLLDSGIFQRQRSSLNGGHMPIRRREMALDCICIDCKLVTSCKAYHFVETKHEQPHMTLDPTFTPKDGSPTIHVNIRTVRTEEQQETQKRMLKEHASETQQAEAKQALGGEADETETSPAAGSDGERALHGETVYDLSPVTTYEYDVVACENYVEDKGCWVRNMPEEIRRANPDFVPT